MPYSDDSPFKEIEIRVLAGSACYVETAIAAGGVWKTDELENILKGDEQSSRSGQFRRLLNGILSRNETAISIQNKFCAEKCHFIRWKDLPLWKALSLRPLSHQDIESLLLTIESDIKFRIWAAVPSNDIFNKYHLPRLEISERDIYSISQFKSLEALLALIVFSRETYDSRLIHLHKIAASQCAKIFPHVLTQHPQLYIRRRRITNRLRALIWNPPERYLDDIYSEMEFSKLNKILQPLETTARLEGIQHAPKDILFKYD